MKKTILVILLLTTPVYAGTSFTVLSRTLEIKEMAEQVIRTAKESSQKSLSKEEIREQYEKAKEVLSRDGAMVQVSSQIWEE